MASDHLSSQFNSELNDVSSRIMIMGGLVETQVIAAVDALKKLDLELVDQVFGDEKKVNQMEITIDQDLTTIIARRQPTARDLRLLVAISKTTTNLERVGDEATKIARMAKLISETGMPKNLVISDLYLIVDLAMNLLRRSLDALARLDVDSAVEIIQGDDQIDNEFDSFARKLMTYMMEDPRTISVCLNLLFVAKALERVGDHAANIAEFVIYIVKGEDVRHLSSIEVNNMRLQGR